MSTPRRASRRAEGAPVLAALDLQALQVEGFADRGIGRYAAAFTTALAERGRVAAALLAPELPPPAGLPRRLVTDDLVRWDGAATMREVLAAPGPIVHHSLAPFLHSGPTDPSVLTVPPHWAGAGCPRVATLYDLIPLRAARHYLSAPGALERYRSRAGWVATADLVLAISEHTRSEAMELLGCEPARVVNVGAGVSSYFGLPDGTDEELFQHHLGRWRDRPFLICVAGSDPRKNTERLIDAAGLLSRRGTDIGLVVVGHLTELWVDRLRQAAQAAGVADRMALTGAVSDELLRACYRRAELTVMPSLSEGSGLPVLESAACGTAAAGSGTTALAEVTATALAQFDPTDAESIAECIQSLLGDPERRRAVVEAQAKLAAGATWGAVADVAARAYDDLAERLPPSSWSSPSGVKPSLLLAGPVPPEDGGISIYNHRLLQGIGSRAAALVVTEGASATGDPRVRRVLPEVVGFDVRPCSYDAVVYTLGNSSGHLGRAQMALRHPGWIWLHEVRLPALATTALESLGDEGFASTMRRLLARAYPGRSPWPAARRAGRSNLDLIDAGVGLLPLLAERTCGFLVNSESAKRFLLLDLAPLAHRPPVHVLPPACPPTGPLRRRTAAPEPLLVAFGIVSMAKRPDLLVDTAAQLGCRLAFVGPGPPILGQVIGDRARLRRISDRVEVVGAVDESSWRAWMERATVAVQLRDSSSGEMSAAVLDALSVGLPVATNLASAAEYPDDARLLLPSLRPEDMAEALGALLASPERQEVLSAGGLAFAATHQHEHLADALLSTVMA